jgi:hypothetical protein
MYFNLRKGGWTESLYTGASIAGAFAGISALADKRITFLVNAGSLDFVGVRDMSTPRLAVFSELGSLRTGIAGATAYRDLYNAAVMCRFTTTTSKSSPWLHGCPDDYMIGDAAGQFTLSGAGQAVINAYLAFLLGQGLWQLRVLDTGLALGTPQISAITYIAGVVQMTIPGYGGIVGDKLIVTGCQGFRANQFNGTWRIVAVAGDLLTVSSGAALTTSFTYTGNSGRARKPGFIFQGITEVSIRKVGTKKMGRPINGPVGRRRAARR